MENCLSFQAFTDRFTSICVPEFMLGIRFNVHGARSTSQPPQESRFACPNPKNNKADQHIKQIHIESGTCTKSGLDRGKLNDIVQRMDRKNIITKPLLTMPGWDRTELVATELAWNGRAYQCYLCSGQYASLRALDQHINSGTHEQNIYHCPKRSCGREYKSLSGLIQHMESESCGVMRFEQIQKGARSGIGNMVGRMLKG